ncbi:protein transport protein gos1 [Malassezia vespertilionis]|uniref:Golgi SNAP receptor complex member 1 n=1 Tax=Malassezia vespertilionis TaxID=2020962 RepID=A0A2N1JDX0_9BASI|nr:protein transport protein gos1 [Malassezia vespertilionis]PKI84757.1 hypothetical protein MVES_001334 [Malassezia vespertilionis]WFD06073.1 protein transport protein gos1 [Malassezia vespertilionis]
MAWEAQSRRARQVQSRLDAKLTGYSQLVLEAASSTSPFSSAPSDAVALDMENGAQRLDRAAVETEIQALLAQYKEAQEELAMLLNDPMLPPSQTQQHAVQRHRELLIELERDFFRSRTNLTHALDKKALLGHVKQDIDSYRLQHANEMEAYLDERGHLQNAHRMMDDTLDQAYATQSEFRSQHSQLAGALTRMRNTVAQVPGLNNILTLISRRRRRDTVIIALVIGVCVFILLMMGTR